MRPTRCCGDVEFCHRYRCPCRFKSLRAARRVRLRKMGNVRFWAFLFFPLLPPFIWPFMPPLPSPVPFMSNLARISLPPRSLLATSGDAAGRDLALLHGTPSGSEFRVPDQPSAGRQRNQGRGVPKKWLSTPGLIFAMTLLRMEKFPSACDPTFKHTSNIGANPDLPLLLSLRRLTCMSIGC